MRARPSSWYCQAAAAGRGVDGRARNGQLPHGRGEVDPSLREDTNTMPRLQVLAVVLLPCCDFWAWFWVACVRRRATTVIIIMSPSSPASPSASSPSQSFASSSSSSPPSSYYCCCLSHHQHHHHRHNQHSRHCHHAQHRLHIDLERGCLFRG